VISLKILPVKRHGEQTATIWKFRTMSAALRIAHVRAASRRKPVNRTMPAKSCLTGTPRQCRTPYCPYSTRIVRTGGILRRFGLSVALRFL
jgi:lipopolysaccharide/colanic/teichoic acid biosynthesis glycosyltransferase